MTGKQAGGPCCLWRIFGADLVVHLRAVFSDSSIICREAEWRWEALHRTPILSSLLCCRTLAKHARRLTAAHTDQRSSAATVFVTPFGWALTGRTGGYIADVGAAVAWNYGVPTTDDYHHRSP